MKGREDEIGTKVKAAAMRSMGITDVDDETSDEEPWRLQKLGLYVSPLSWNF